MPAEETAEADARVEMFNAGLTHAVRAVYGLGVRLVELAPGRAVGTVPMDSNRNHFGGVYAGALFAVAEMSAALCLWGPATRVGSIRP